MQATMRGPGLVFVLPFLESATIIDVRVKVFEVFGVGDDDVAE